jgi:hypothetical protein
VAISSEGVSSMILFTLSGVIGIAILRMFIENISNEKYLSE